jgi:hypothetical protein
MHHCAVKPECRVVRQALQSDTHSRLQLKVVVKSISWSQRFIDESIVIDGNKVPFIIIKQNKTPKKKKKRKRKKKRAREGYGRLGHSTIILSTRRVHHGFHKFQAPERLTEMLHKDSQ